MIQPSISRFAFAILVLTGLVTGCGYSVRALTPPGIRTVSVDVFDNLTYRRLNELFVTRAVVQEIQSKTELQVVEPQRADSILEGTIVDLESSVITEDISDSVTESSVVITINLVWRDRRTNEIIMQRSGLQVSEQFRPPQGESLETGFGRVFDKIARRVVEEMEATNW